MKKKWVHLVYIVVAAMQTEIGRHSDVVSPNRWPGPVHWDCVGGGGERKGNVQVFTKYLWLGVDV